MKPVTQMASGFLLLVAVVHLARFFGNIPLTIGEVDVPAWASLIAALVTASLAMGIRREHREETG